MSAPSIAKSIGVRAKPRLEVVVAQDQHVEPLAAFYRDMWDPHTTAESVALARVRATVDNRAEPGRTPPTIIAIQGDRVLGCVTSLPILLWDGSRQWPAYWTKGLMVRPEWRNGPVGFSLLRHASQVLPRTMALVVAPPALRLFDALGFFDLGRLPNLVRPLATGRMIHRLGLAADGAVPKAFARLLRGLDRSGLGTLVGRAADAALRWRAAAARLRSMGLVTGAGEGAVVQAGELDALWSSVRPALGGAVVRDACYLMSRYGAQRPDSRYHWITARRDGLLTGVAILRSPAPSSDPRLAGLRIAVVADVLAAPADRATMVALLGAVEHRAVALDADALLGSASSPGVAAALRRQAYWRVPANVHVLLRDVTGEATRWRPVLADWWLTRGDSEADFAF